VLSKLHFIQKKFNNNAKKVNKKLKMLKQNTPDAGIFQDSKGPLWTLGK
jgi:hypothetical protein